jgi:hypothetical protein
LAKQLRKNSSNKKLKNKQKFFPRSGHEATISWPVIKSLSNLLLLAGFKEEFAKIIASFTNCSDLTIL